MKDSVERSVQKIIDDINCDFKDEVAAAEVKRNARLCELKEMIEQALVEHAKKTDSISDTRNDDKTTTTTARIARIRTKPGFAQMVREIVEETDRKFDKNFIEKKIKMKNPGLADRLGKRTVPIILKRLETAGKIVEIEKGMGRRTNKYKKQPHEQTAFPKKDGEKEV